MKTTVLILGLLLTTIGAASAREMPFAGLDYTQATLTTSNAELELTAVRLRVGSQFNRYFGFEYQGALGLDEDTAPVTGGSVTGRLKALTGAYLRGRLPLGNAVAFYGTVGYSWSWLTVTPQVPGLVNRTSPDNDVSAGGGIELRLLGKHFISVDYMEYTEGLSAVSAGVRFAF